MFKWNLMLFSSSINLQFLYICFHPVALLLHTWTHLTSVSCLLTTTGCSVFENEARQPPSVPALVVNDIFLQHWWLQNPVKVRFEKVNHHHLCRGNHIFLYFIISNISENKSQEHFLLSAKTATVIMMAMFSIIVIIFCEAKTLKTPVALWFQFV